MMNKIIEEYYTQSKAMPVIVKQKLSKFQQHSDIQQEFEYWIQSGEYKTDDCVIIGGYTAKKLSELSEHIDGEGAFMLLIELRETPEKAMFRISKGFKMK